VVQAVLYLSAAVLLGAAAGIAFTGRLPAWGFVFLAGGLALLAGTLPVLSRGFG
jgi:hypothetical protein